jgi:hypothetical protein
MGVMVKQAHFVLKGAIEGGNRNSSNAYIHNEREHGPADFSQEFKAKTLKGSLTETKCGLVSNPA